ncbi:hypothetical protein DFH07DRAFT_973682 [Mycena maculata]|uniref:CxC2-like cysteine cluster KDZ transposase-associated domain-containing protein n=1 Tax=Mycena maculata TaxID=230809 RepID=A0AAD7HDA4_9AGAR|nr:hypothetical protein DFH07DRAFT_973682 [Mycena maculata]
MNVHVNRGGRTGSRMTARWAVKSAVGTDDSINDAQNTLTADRGVHFSRDLNIRREELLNMAHKKRRLEPEHLQDPLAQWTPVLVDEVDLRPTDDSPVFDEMADTSNASNASDAPATVLGKRKTYDSSTNPFRLWRPLAGLFSDEILRHAGLGDWDASEPSCALCDRKCVSGTSGLDVVCLFKCLDCGQFLQCKKCCVEGHVCTPLHRIEEWNGQFWIPVTLRELGLVYQLGHGGMACPYPDPRLLTMTVLELPYIHRVHYRYCKCQKAAHATNLQQCLRNGWYPATITDPATCASFRTLETFRLQNVVGNMNVHDYITAIERQTDATASTKMDWLPHRYKEFITGCTHNPAGLAATEPRQAAVLCWACPHDRRNLPTDWRNVDKKYQFLYMLLVALDANFKLKNRMRANEHPDPPLGPGWGYFVDPEKYRKHLKSYVPEKDVSTCIAFAALLQKDTRGTAGLRTSGVGSCVCARHECVLPNGIGDLQKGERFVNMDYILLAALTGFGLLFLTISYDISCQWKINLARCNAKMPKSMRLPLETINWQCALPVWHAASHEDECQNANSLSFKPGVGKSDGEGDALHRKLAVARTERERQVKAFAEVNRTVEMDVRKAWQAEIDEWLKDPSQPNPYMVDKNDGPTEVQVRLELKKEEEREAASGKALVPSTSATTAGLQIEQAQRRIITEQAGLALIVPEREARVQELRITLLQKIGRFRKLQAIWMPGAARAILADEEKRDEDSLPLRAEHIKLYMPHELPADDRAQGCVKGLADMEARLRAAQCASALTTLRRRLHAKRHLITFRNENLTGQVQTTKAHTLIGQVGDRVNASAAKYRKGREALVALKTDSFAPHFRELRDDDIRLDGDNGESDSAAKKKLAMISSGRGARAPRNAPGQSKRVMSWIWTTTAGPGDKEKDLHDSVRVEWARAKARKNRWEEEVLLLQEEMRRTLRYLEWQAGWWEEHMDTKLDSTPEVRAGARAYALKQAWMHRRLAAHFKSKWETSANVDMDAAMEGADLAQFFITPSKL